MTGTRPAAARAMAATTVRRSCARRLPASAIVAFATSPWTPASRYAATLRSSAASSIAPAASNGVVTAGMMPSKWAMGPIMPPADGRSQGEPGSAAGRVRPAARVQPPDLGGRLGVAALAPVEFGDRALERVEPAGQRANRVGHRVGQVDPVGVGPLGLAAVDADDVAGIADDRRVRRHVGDHDAVRADLRAVADRDRAQQLRARPDRDVVLHRRVAVAGREAGAAERDALVERHVVADLRGLADDDAGPVVDEQALAD